jgi:hypothetical protein
LNPNLHGGVLFTCKGEIIHNCPLHTNLKVVALQVRVDLLKNVGIIRMEKKHNPIRGQKLIDEVENKHNVVLIPPIP